MLKQLNERRGSDEGFTLIELLIAIVVIGVLSAVVIVGIGGLTNSGKTAACNTSADAARAATAVFYANKNGAYPTTFTDMTNPLPAGTPKMLELASGVTATDATHLDGTGWTLTMGLVAGSPPTYTCS
jgi:prepilin-type N-terminal cleavage/methylation domain-containing protein